MENKQAQSLLCSSKDISLALELLTAVGEAIADDENHGFEMVETCGHIRTSLSYLEELCDRCDHQKSVCSPQLGEQRCSVSENNSSYQEDINRAAQTLKNVLIGVTRILLVVDTIIVRDVVILLPCHTTAENKNIVSKMHQFTEFVKSFCDVGMEIVRFGCLLEAASNQDCSPTVYLSSNKCMSNDFKFRSIHLECARKTLNRSAKVLMTSTLNLEALTESHDARENRDTVLCQMRRALDLVHFILKRSITSACSVLSEGVQDIPALCDQSVMQTLKEFVSSMQIMHISPISDFFKIQMTTRWETILESIQSFTDSAHTKHEHRQFIILLSGEASCQIAKVLSNISQEPLFMESEVGEERLIISNRMDEEIRTLVTIVRKMGEELQEIALEHACLLTEQCEATCSAVTLMFDGASKQDIDQVQCALSQFVDFSQNIDEAWALVRNVTEAEDKLIRGKHLGINLNIFGPQVVVAGHTWCSNPQIEAALNNLYCFGNLWVTLSTELVEMCQSFKDASISQGRVLQGLQYEKKHFSPQHVPNSSPFQDFTANNAFERRSRIQQVMGTNYSFNEVDPSGKKNTTDNFLSIASSDKASEKGLPGSQSRPLLSSTDGPDDKAQCSSSYGHMHMKKCEKELINTTSLEYYKDFENNEIIKKAEKMSCQTKDMFEFTTGSGKIKTTQDLFTLAEYFGEEANQFYKVVRLFSYNVPTGEDKRSLMAISDHVPKHCHALQMLIQSPIVGKAATFTKVDSIMKESGHIMQLVLRVVDICYSNAKHYNLDFSNISLESRGTTNDDTHQPFGSSSATNSGNSSGNESS